MTVGPLIPLIPCIPRILVVDDEHIIADSLAMILQQQGYSAQAVYSGEEAVVAAATHAPDVVISDILMGEMNGIEAVAKIREFLPDCQVLLFSGQPGIVDMLAQARQKDDSFEIFPKPIHPDVLVELIRSRDRKPH